MLDKFKDWSIWLIKFIWKQIYDVLNAIICLILFIMLCTVCAIYILFFVIYSIFRFIYLIISKYICIFKFRWRTNDYKFLKYYNKIKENKK